MAFGSVAIVGLVRHFISDNYIYLRIGVEKVLIGCLTLFIKSFLWNPFRSLVKRTIQAANAGYGSCYRKEMEWNEGSGWRNG